MRQIVDLTQTFTGQMPVFPGDPPASLNCESEHGGWTQYRFAGGLHSGTHLDAPLHRIPGGQPAAAIAPERFLGPGRLYDVRGRKSFGTESWEELPRCGEIVLFLTGMSAAFGAPAYYTDYPELTADAARALAAAGVKLVGLDSPSPDRDPYPVHSILLEAGIPIVENLVNLELLCGVPQFDVIALPAKFAADAAPVRVLALCPGSAG